MARSTGRSLSLAVEQAHGSESSSVAFSFPFSAVVVAGLLIVGFADLEGTALDVEGCVLVTRTLGSGFDIASLFIPSASSSVVVVGA